ncbi:MAG: HD domain-containing protein [Gemmatimonadetes bacterium]|nr:HD domain-containing protein [Gemmatimonadota bacterium]
MTPAELDGTLAFLRAAEALKSTTRSAWTASGTPESTAAHTWRLCLMAMVLADALPGVDQARVLRMLVVHDLAEAVSGDIPAPAQVGAPPKGDRERHELTALVAPLPPGPRQEILALWEEYEAAATREAQVAKALDKLETILQHVQGANPPDFDYAFNLGYGVAHTDRVPELKALRAVLDAATRARADGASADYQIRSTP